MKEIKNKAQSIRNKLLTVARSKNINFDTILLRYMQERLLYRLEKSPYKKNFILKGGLFLLFSDIPINRPTKDIDFLGLKVSRITEDLHEVFKNICMQQSDDAVNFDTSGITSETIKENADYQGVRIKIKGYLGNATKVIQIDIAFDDIVYPDIQIMEYPTFFENTIRINAYSKESVIAEKFDAMLVLSYANSRMKDFYDVYHLLK
ncbi:MAG TPA: hypothetical protein DDY71_00620 [Spirochaetia bacterium]|nr:hypothetical protein [Spirochaetia bacterium]HBI36121.1 hypothetical protein [Spirochaetia bacterium]